MNALTTYEAKPLRAQSIDEAREPLLILFSAYPEPYSDKQAAGIDELMNARVSAYMLGLDKLPSWAIRQAVTDFVQGRVERPARRKGALPTVEELASVTREHVDKEATRQRVEAQRQEQIAAARSDFTWEHRQCMAFKNRVLLMGLSRREVEKVDEANRRGIEAMIALGHQWGIAVPEFLLRSA